MLTRTTDLALNRRDAKGVHLIAEQADDHYHRVAVVSIAGAKSVALAVGTEGPSSVVSLDADLARTVGTALLAAARASEGRR